MDDLIIKSPLVLAVEEPLEFIKKTIRLGFESLRRRHLTPEGQITTDYQFLPNPGL